jgi:parafibromin
MSGEDPLLALRNSIKSKTPITYAIGDQPTDSFISATHIVLPQSFLKSSPTRYRKPGVSDSSEPSSNPQDFFSLEAVYLAWLLRDAPGAEYMKQARENGLTLGFVSVTERKSVVDWLEGRTSDQERIVPLLGQFFSFVTISLIT